MRQLHLYISGRVQGVSFRASSRTTAIGLHLTGWTKNLADGRVEAVAQGPEEILKIFLNWCRQGPPRAHVTKVDFSWEPVTENLTEFVVRF